MPTLERAYRLREVRPHFYFLVFGEDQNVSIWVANACFAGSPGLIGGWQLDYRAARGNFGVQAVHVGYPEKGVGHSGALGLV